MDDSTRRRLCLPPLPRPASSSKPNNHQRSSRPQWSVGSYGQGILTPGPRPTFGGSHGVGAGGMHRSGPSLSPWSTGSSYLQTPVTPPPPTNSHGFGGVGGGIYSSGPSFSQGQGSQWIDPIPGSSYHQSQTTTPLPVYDVVGGGIGSGLSCFSPQEQDTGGLWGSRSPPYCYGTPMPGESLPDCYDYDETPTPDLASVVAAPYRPYVEVEVITAGSMSYWGSGAWSVDSDLARVVAPYVEVNPSRPPSPTSPLPPPPLEQTTAASVDFAVPDPTNPPPSPPPPPATPEAAGSKDAEGDRQGSGVNQEEPALSEGWDWTILFGTSAVGELPDFFLEQDEAAEGGLLLGNKQKEAGTEAANGLLLGSKQKEAATEAADDGLLLGNKQQEAATEAADEGLLLGNKQKEAAALTEAAGNMGSGSGAGGGSSSCMDVDAKAPLAVGFPDGLFTHEEMKKIMADKALAELVLTDAKRVRRIIHNRRDSAKVKERKKNNVLSLEREAVRLLKENAATSALVRSIKSATEALITENNQLRITLQGYEQLSEAQRVQHEALAAQLRHLKAQAGQINGREI